MKESAIDFIANWNGKSFFISGQSGAGKTHLCTAICNELLNKDINIKYFMWVRDGTQIKAIINDVEAYDKKINSLISVDALYIDDFFKQNISDADIRLAYEIINGRYNLGKTIIISSERNLDFIRAIKDRSGEAIAGRIYELCDNGKYCIDISGEDKNCRFYS